MCNNNGHCRKFDAGTMCPSYRVTRDELHLTRGRANTLRLALSGQLGAGFRVAGGARRARPVRELQGLPSRLPHGRRHGEDEDRVPAPVAGGARADAEGARHRVPAALGAVGGAPAVARQPAQHAPRSRASDRARERALGAPLAARLAARHVLAHRAHDRECRRGGRAVRRHVHRVLRAGERARRAGGAAGGRLRGRRGEAAAGRRGCRPAAVLRPHVPGRRARRRGEARGAAHGGCAGAGGRPRRDHRRPRALVSFLVARRIPGDGPGRCRAAHSASARC